MSDKALKVTSGAPQDLLLLSEVLKRFRGKVGRTRLLAHIVQHPTCGGGPTHRRNGRKLLFTEADYARVLESFVPVPRERRLAIAAAPSSQGASRRLDAL
ncbi:hypothetical protein HN018_23790 (plasmid) [Lichenicola cladoniae]|uniref:Uncharacterized protein n=1 Tax=Lichenicola cladoniae TaxID=1484109 RepID=A0A6M8HYF6_9PROT|nr:hypothetical protein [Lichenicola cladoniae]NPD70199.1 hypothetical protein [Acetobacteraceae bacterium]QKE93205.1 hypothetical protein HN018_23790 [Lichenicola cladoniae]